MCSFYQVIYSQTISGRFLLLNAKTNVEALREIATLLEGEMVKLNKKGEENIPKVMEIGSYPSLSSFSWSVAIGLKHVT